MSEVFTKKGCGIFFRSELVIETLERIGVFQVREFYIQNVLPSSSLRRVVRQSRMFPGGHTGCPQKNFYFPCTIQTLSVSDTTYRRCVYEIVSLFTFFIIDNVDDERKITGQVSGQGFQKKCRSGQVSGQGVPETWT
jgi:hypothetical protein